MTTRSRWIVTLTLLLGMSACTDSPEDQARKAAAAGREANRLELQALREPNRQKAQATAAAEQEIRKARDDFRQWCQSRMDQIDADVNDARASIQQAAPQARAELERQLGDLQHKRDALRADLEEAKTQSASSWDAFKHRVELRFDELAALLDGLHPTDTSHARK
ncbi:MAG TPA: hypothetical protein VF331_05370 [Polyangiales bacterium]